MPISDQLTAMTAGDHRSDHEAETVELAVLASLPVTLASRRQLGKIAEIVRRQARTVVLDREANPNRVSFGA